MVQPKRKAIFNQFVAFLISKDRPHKVEQENVPPWSKACLP